MLDIRWIRDNPDAFDAALKTRGMDAMAAELIALDAARRAAQTELQEGQTRRNEASKQIGAAKAKGGDADALIAEVAALKDRMQSLETDEASASEQLDSLISAIPNVPADDVPVGDDEAANIELRKIGTPPVFDFEVKDHVALGEALGGMSFENASKLSGARFVVLSGQIARLERALGAFMLDLHTQEYGYREVSPPILVNQETLYGTGQLPKFEEDLFRIPDVSDYIYFDEVEQYKEINGDLVPIITDPSMIDRIKEFSKSRSTGVIGKSGLKRLKRKTDRYLIPTAEVPLTNLVSGDILEEAGLPLRFTALTQCFRSEAGAAGRDTRGMLRQHQFNKVELVSIVHPDKSVEEHERMTGAAEEVLKRLGLAYRVMVLSTGDMGFSARKTYDLEVWLPGQETYREISSCSNCGDFQARRMRARFRPDGGKGTQFVHTLNGSGLAVGRCLIAVLENYQQADSSVVVPEALRPYMGGCDRLTPE